MAPVLATGAFSCAVYKTKPRREAGVLQNWNAIGG